MYLKVVSTYIHLNPARAGLVEIGEQKLKGYRWSSYPFYIAGNARAPAWLCCQAVLNSLGLRGAQRKGLDDTQLSHLSKGAPEKAGLAWLVRQRSTVSLRWASQRLGMGDYSRVSQGHLKGVSP